jgi:hypothetical protein
MPKFVVLTAFPHSETVHFSDIRKGERHGAAMKFPE